MRGQWINYTKEDKLFKWVTDFDQFRDEKQWSKLFLRDERSNCKFKLFLLCE